MAALNIPRAAIIRNITRASTMMMPPRNTNDVLPERKPRIMRTPPMMAKKPMRYCITLPVMKFDPVVDNPPTIGEWIMFTLS